MKLLSAGLLALFIALVSTTPRVVASTAGGASIAGQAAFGASTTLAAGSQPRALAVADFDNNGSPDIVAAGLSNSVAVLFGTGAGQFSPALEIELGRRPTSVTAGDVNADGNQDIVTANFNDEGVQVLFGDGAGGFAAPLVAEVGPGTGEPGSAGPVDVIVEDFDVDGDGDIITANGISENVSFLYGSSDGTLTGVYNFLRGIRSSAVRTGDFDGDDRPDLAVTTAESVVLLLNISSGSVSVGSLTNATGLITGDFDGDGDDDFATVAQDSVMTNRWLRVFLGEGDGSTFSVLSSSLSTASEQPAALTVGDISADGLPEIVLTYGEARKAVVMRNLGSGRFQEIESLATNSGPAGTALHDVDLDGVLDLLVATSDGIQVFPGTGADINIDVEGDALELWLQAGVTLEDRSVLADRSGNLNNGTFYNFDDPASAYHSSDEVPVDRWIEFDGVDDMIGTSDLLDAPHVMTMAVWFRTTTAGGKIAGFESSATELGSQYDRHFYIDGNGYLQFGVYNGSSITLMAEDRVTDGQWHFAVATMELNESTARVNLYMDGEYQTTVSAPQFVSYNGYWRLGGGNHINWPGYSQTYFKGDIGSLRIYNQPLTPAQINALYAGPVIQPTATPIAGGALPDPLLWLNAGARGLSPEVLEDSSSYNNDGALLNFEDIEAAFGQDTEPPLLDYITFDGVDDVVTTSTLMTSPVNFSMAVRFRTTEARGKLAGFHSSVSGNSDYYDRHIYIDDEGRLRFGIQAASSNAHLQSLLSRDPVTDGEWHLAVATLQYLGGQSRIALYVDGVRHVDTEVDSVLDYFGYWRVGSGDLDRWGSSNGEYFSGDINEFIVYDVTLTAEQVAVLSGIAQPEATPTPPVIREPQPGINITSDIDGEDLTLDIVIANVPGIETSRVYVVRDDGTEFLVGPGAASMSWTGEAITGMYRVEARAPGLIEDEQRVLAFATEPVFVPIATPGEIGVAVGVGVAVAAAGSAAASGGFSVFDLIMRVLKIFLTEKLRRKTRHVDLKNLPSWIAAVVAMVLMAGFLTAGKPGALQHQSLGEALVVTSASAVMFRSFTLVGGVFLAFITGQKPRYLIWAAGSVSFAITSIVFHSPFGYTGYMDRKPGNVNRDARFAAAGFSVMLTLAGVFLFVGSVTRMSFAETGIMLVFGVLAAIMLPFPMMGGNALWKWKKPAGVASGVIGFVPYCLFLYGLLPYDAIYALAMVGFGVFAVIMIADMWIADRERQAERVAASAATPAVEAASITEAPPTVAAPAAETPAAPVAEVIDETPAEAPVEPPPQSIPPIAPAAELDVPLHPSPAAGDADSETPEASARPDKTV